jgi:hypothetical protein
MLFKIFGTDRQTGQTVGPVMFEASDLAAAADYAVVQGILVTRIDFTPEAELPPPVFAATEDIPPPVAEAPEAPVPAPIVVPPREVPRREVRTPVSPQQEHDPPRRVPQPAPQPAPRPIPHDPDRPFEAHTEYPLLNFYRYVSYFLGVISILSLGYAVLYAAAAIFAGTEEEISSGLRLAFTSLLGTVAAFSIAQLIELSFRLLESVNDLRERLQRSSG